MTGDDERPDVPDVETGDERTEVEDGDDEAGWTFDEGMDDGDGTGAVDDHEAASGASDASTGEPLGGLRDRVQGEDDDAAPPTLFPEESPTAAATGGEESDASLADDDAGDEGAAVDRGDDETVVEDVPGVPDEDRDRPLGDIAAGVEGRRERKTKADEALFDEVDVGELDADELWAQVETDEPTVEPRGEREIREVQKRKYCSQCPYFAEPPDVGCSHEGTDILEQVDMEHFKVADCPVVLEDERLEDVTTE
ncbi:hypothetical protein [Halorubellus salinus]|uniref:hypothetical protein n=1 Tax=Halorubellus salinus TaxID=755309 RepID=UPI001D068CC2|nr:hypothetical protein [Halorubellus salinus]